MVSIDYHIVLHDTYMGGYGTSNACLKIHDLYKVLTHDDALQLTAWIEHALNLLPVCFIAEPDILLNNFSEARKMEHVNDIAKASKDIHVLERYLAQQLRCHTAGNKIKSKVIQKVFVADYTVFQFPWQLGKCSQLTG